MPASLLRELLLEGTVHFHLRISALTIFLPRTIEVKASTLSSNKQATIQLGLYLSDTSKTARYMGRFDANGQLQLKGLKGGSYFLKAFIDENQDGVSSKTESQDQFFRPINIEEHQQDALSFYLTKPIDEKDTAAVAVNAPVQNDSLQLSKQTSSLVLELDTLQENLMLELFLGERSVRSQNSV